MFSHFIVLLFSFLASIPMILGFDIIYIFMKIKVTMIYVDFLGNVEYRILVIVEVPSKLFLYRQLRRLLLLEEVVECSRPYSEEMISGEL